MDADIKSTIARINRAMKGERWAIADYTRSASSRSTDPTTAKLFEHIGDQEKHHLEELRVRLRYLKRVSG